MLTPDIIPFNYYTVRRGLNSPAALYFDIGDRGVGKTFAWKYFLLKHAMETGRKFIWLRRYQTEIDALAGDVENQSFFGDLKRCGKFKDIECKTEYHKKTHRTSLLMNGKECGIMIALTFTPKLKGNDFSEYDFCVFDEFLIMTKSRIQYINKYEEPTTILEWFTTMYRDRKIKNKKIVFLGNATEFANPYFLYFKIPRFEGNNFIDTQRGIEVNVIKNPQYVEHMKQSDFGKLIEGTAYGNYALGCEFYADSKTFIDNDKGDNATYSCTLSYMGFNFGVWVNYKKGLYFINMQCDMTFFRAFALTTDSHNVNFILLQNRRGSYLEKLSQAYRYGFVRFSDSSVKKIATEALAMLH